MNDPINKLQEAFHRGFSGQPKIGGFPYLAESLRQAGVSRNIWSLPSCQSIYVTSSGNVVVQHQTLTSGIELIPPFDEQALVKALRTDQAGESTFPDFLTATWRAGVIGYDVDFNDRKVVYFGVNGEYYEETYPAVTL